MTCTRPFAVELPGSGAEIDFDEEVRHPVIVTPTKNRNKI
jgi:hypothetical protein